jgi:arsenate reductase (thioredoxin)
MEKKRVLILCTGNSARSQMAEGLLRHDVGDLELGIDISDHRSKHVDEFLDQSFDYVLTVCDSAKESCPVFPNQSKRIHMGFEVPAAFHGTEQERLALFRRVRDEIRDYLKTFPS